MTILIVEDHEPMRRMIGNLVAGYAEEIRECADAGSAIAAYRDRPADYVLMDLQLPGMDGIAATRAILAADPQAHVVIVTAFDNVHLRQLAAAAGCCAYILKSNLLPLFDLLLRGRALRAGQPG
ncbi:MAG: response regulator transcription factor [Bryobacteraceae bacterium]|jgi:CheY-like chemotaxis protein